MKKLKPTRDANYRRPSMPCALTIAGSDSGGGAGMQADLKTFAALNVHGTSVITCVTAQNPRGVRSLQGIQPKIVEDQIRAVLEAFSPAAVKTGMLFSKAIIETTIECLEDIDVPLIVDPVMISTSGAVLLQPSALKILKEKLLPRATLATPNLAEAEQLLGRTITSEEQLRTAARDFHARFGCAALVKGGHLRSGAASVDFFFNGETELMLEAPFIRGLSTHGTGCTFSAAIAASCARGEPLVEAVVRGKEFISNAIAASQRAGGHDVLNSFWNG